MTRAEKQVAAFNKKFSKGENVKLKKDFQDGLVPATLTSEAYLLCGQPVVMLQEVSGCYHITHVFKTTESKDEAR